MSVTLVLEHAPHRQAETRRTIEAGDLVIGRGAGSDWQIDDPDMYVSRTHCIVSITEDGAVVRDASRGGLFVDGASEPLGPGSSVALRDGMRLRLGDFVLRVDMQAADGPAPRKPANGTPFIWADPAPEAKTPERPDTLPDPFEAAVPAGSRPPDRERKAFDFDDPFTLDDHDAPRQRERSRGPGYSDAPPERPEPNGPAPASGSGLDWPPREERPRSPAPEPDRDEAQDEAGGGFSWDLPPNPTSEKPRAVDRRPPEADHGGAPDEAGGGFSWDFPSARPDPRTVATPEKARAVERRPPEADHGGAPNEADGGFSWDSPLARPDPRIVATSEKPRAVERRPPEADRGGAPDEAGGGFSWDAPSARRRQRAESTSEKPTAGERRPPEAPRGEGWSSHPASSGRERPASGGLDEGALRAAFFRGLGVEPKALSPEEAEAEMEALGARFRQLTDGLVQMLRARAQEKRNVRVAQTIIGSAEVNPLKFAASTEDAVAALVALRGPGYLPPEPAIEGALRDLADHQLRTWTAVQAALRRMVDRFDPEALEGEIEATGRLETLLAGGRSAKLWQLYRERYREIARSAEERFLGDVGADFRDAYEGGRE